MSRGASQTSAAEALLAAIHPRAFTVLALLLASTFPSGAPLRAQESGSSAQQEALVRQLDSLMPLYARASKEAAAARAAREARERARSHPRTDTILVGPLRVIALPEQVGVARGMFGDAWKTYESGFGTSAALSRTFFTFEWSLVRREIYVSDDVRRVEAPGYVRRSRVQRFILDAIGAALAGDYAGTRLAQEWYGGPVDPPQDPAAIYREVAAGASKANRACIGGDAVGCEHALGLAVAGDPYSTLYTPEERRELVSRMYIAANSPQARLADECVRSQEACDELLAESAEGSRVGYFSPLSMQARASLLWFALQRGGPGAWGRILAHPEASPEEALSEASGMGVAPLVDAWRSWLVGFRPARKAGLAASILSVLFWVLLLAGLAMRSTRWRLG